MGGQEGGRKGGRIYVDVRLIDADGGEVDVSLCAVSCGYGCPFLLVGDWS